MMFKKKLIFINNKIKINFLSIIYIILLPLFISIKVGAQTRPIIFDDFDYNTEQ